MPIPKRLTGRRAQGWVIALVILIMFELLVARSGWIWSYEARSDTGIVDVLEHEVIPHVDDPSVVFLGSSRIRDAVLPRDLETLMDLPRNSVLNLGLTSGLGYDSLKLYERNRERLSMAEIVVVGVELFDLTASPKPEARARRYATLSERLEWPGFDKLGLLVGYLWRTFDVRDQVRDLVTSLWRGRNESLPIDPDGRIAWRDPVEAGEASVDVSEVASAIAGVKPGRGHSIYIEELISMLRRDGVDVWVVHIPVRDETARAYEESNPGLVAHFLRSIQHFEGVVGIDAPWQASSVGMRDTSFYDYGHPAVSGARFLTERYARLLDGEPSRRRTG